MSGFTAGCQRQAKAGWKAAASTWRWNTERRQKLQQEPLTTKAGSGCCGCLLIGPVWFILPALIVALVEVAILLYALVYTALAGVGAGVDSIFGRRGAVGQVPAGAGLQHTADQLDAAPSHNPRLVAAQPVTTTTPAGVTRRWRTFQPMRMRPASSPLSRTTPALP